MPENNFGSVFNLFTRFCCKLRKQIFDLNSGSLHSIFSLLNIFGFLIGQIIKILIMKIKVAFRKYLE